MENFLVGLAMMIPAIFVVLLVAGGVITVSVWAYMYFSAPIKGKDHLKRDNAPRRERRSGRDRRHSVSSNGGRGPAAVS